MTHLIKPYLIAAIVALIAAACSDPDRFEVTLDIPDIGKQSVTMIYYADGAVCSSEAHADDKGVIKFEGVAKEPALVEFHLTAPGTPLLLLVMKNGEHAKVKFTLADKSNIEIKGSQTSEELIAFLKDNDKLITAGKFSELNARIKDYVIAHPASLTSTALLVTHFRIDDDKHLADSLLNVIKPEARPVNMIENFNSVLRYCSGESYKNTVHTLNLTGVNDSIVTVTTSAHSYTLLAFTGQDNTGRDSLARVLSSLRKEYGNERLGIVEISLLADSAVWRRVVRPDSMQWTQTWVPGSVAASAIERLHVTHTPFFIVADSVGRQLYRTSYPSNARSYIKKKLRD